ncbi:homoserine dehydrogenase [Litoribrevibacter euphylliae]|uniref:Homoserine dehydrogenase n=1 Tax=Litoribrevibacter euphylliae TaxID=1834034 RepID=A0ABV7HAR2_9GAMM
MKPVSVGICGLGTVGSGTFNILKRNAEKISGRIGRDIVVTQVGARRDNPACDLTGVDVTRDIFDVAKNPNVDVVVELIGGYDVAKELVLTAIEHGKHVVTANKALIAVHGNEIFAAAEKKGVTVAYESAVAGGIPIIKAIREGLAANDIDHLSGIINGTGNFILTEMSQKGRDFGDVLKEAQELGYAEADPTFDVEGIDAAHKLTILASIAFGVPLQFEKAYTEGISKVTPQDVKFADELGYRIKHLGIAKLTQDGVELRVHPTLIHESQLIAKVDGVMNAVAVHGDAVGDTMYYGPGAGSEPTASAVIADLVDLARTFDADSNARPAHLGFQPESINNIGVLPVEEIETSYYLRMEVQDHAGVMAKLTQILSDRGISIEAMMQKEAKGGSSNATVVLLTHEVKEKVMNEAITEIEAFDDVSGSVTRIRAEHSE